MVLKDDGSYPFFILEETVLSYSSSFNSALLFLSCDTWSSCHYFRAQLTYCSWSLVCWHSNV